MRAMSERITYEIARAEAIRAARQMAEAEVGLALSCPEMRGVYEAAARQAAEEYRAKMARALELARRLNVRGGHDSQERPSGRESRFAA